MGRSNVTPIQQPTDTTCGPSALKLGLEILGKRKSLTSLIELCKTNRNGTSTPNLIAAANKLGFVVLMVENATLHHLQSALKYPPSQPRAVLVSYLYDLDEEYEPHPDSGHWAVVSAYMASKSRIVLLDSASSQKKSYDWQHFRTRWRDYDLKREKVRPDNPHFRMVKKWQEQPLMIIAHSVDNLPTFKIKTATLYEPS